MRITAFLVRREAPQRVKAARKQACSFDRLPSRALNRPPAEVKPNAPSSWEMRRCWEFYLAESRHREKSLRRIGKETLTEFGAFLTGLQVPERGQIIDCFRVVQ